MLLSSGSSTAMFSKFNGFKVINRLEKSVISSKTQEVEFEKASLREKKSLEENELVWAAGVVEFENEISS